MPHYLMQIFSAKELMSNILLYFYAHRNNENLPKTLAALFC